MSSSSSSSSSSSLWMLPALSMSISMPCEVRTFLTGSGAWSKPSWLHWLALRLSCELTLSLDSRESDLVIASGLRWGLAVVASNEGCGDSRRGAGSGIVSSTLSLGVGSRDWRRNLTCVPAFRITSTARSCVAFRRSVPSTSRMRSPLPKAPRRPAGLSGSTFLTKMPETPPSRSEWRNRSTWPPTMLMPRLRCWGSRTRDTSRSGPHCWDGDSSGDGLRPPHAGRGDPPGLGEGLRGS
uniref:Uncharacterized protein n=1 Tax=Ixodes ricinus TaxID=34613 RepID=A0A6B0V3X8_IXORI